MHKLQKYEKEKCLFPFRIDLNPKTKRPTLIGDIVKVTGRVYIGSYILGANSLEALKDVGITHILTMGFDMKPYFPDDFVYKIFGLYDFEEQNIIQFWPEATEFIQNTLLENPNHKVFVHCQAGISRAASTTIAYLIRYHQFPYFYAYEFLRKQRKHIRPNFGFRMQLYQWEKEYLKDKQQDLERNIMYDKEVVYPTWENFVNKYIPDERKNRLLKNYKHIFTNFPQMVFDFIHFEIN